ncbi:MAG: hypothetical protein HFF61_06985 [Oscillospiraceae bacterium]|nr:hypothetical protein [Oscillospiraceae bacterium]
MKKCTMLLLALIALALLTVFAACRQTGGEEDHSGAVNAKPVIYLYPEEETEVSVQLDFDGTLTATWPAYPDGGWQVRALPDGTLYDAGGNTYSYLFWEGVTDTEYDFSQGFCVAGEDTGEFLREALSEMGLTPREYNEFIVYWLPRMQENPYNLIAFQGTQIVSQAKVHLDSARLTIDPAPDSLLRVFMAYRPLEEPVEIAPQRPMPFQRKGFTVVEWGGAEVR